MMNIEKLNALADRVEVITAEWMKSYYNVVFVNCNRETYDAHVKLTKEVRLVMRDSVIEVAQLTDNAVTTILLAYAPKDEISIWFNSPDPAQFIRNVAKYRSFNEEYWRSKGWQPIK